MTSGIVTALCVKATIIVTDKGADLVCHTEQLSQIALGRAWQLSNLRIGPSIVQWASARIGPIDGIDKFSVPSVARHPAALPKCKARCYGHSRHKMGCRWLRLWLCTLHNLLRFMNGCLLPQFDFPAHFDLN
jgi:hypothetical protein